MLTKENILDIIKSVEGTSPDSIKGAIECLGEDPEVFMDALHERLGDFLVAAAVAEDKEDSITLVVTAVKAAFTWGFACGKIQGESITAFSEN